jgi:leader peptidase (prepilin peptidase)/N-methyltransferase
MILITNIYIIVIGLIIGSFLNCLIWRIYKEESLKGRSLCPNCRHKINWHDNIPVISFLLLKGRCRYCREAISWQYPAVEIITALLFSISFSVISSSNQFALDLAYAWILIAGLIVVFVYDARWQLVPMNIVWPLTFILFVFNLFLGHSIINMIFAGVLTAGFFLAQYILTKKKGLGEGDIWLGLLIGIAFISFEKIFLIIFLAYFIGAAIGLWMVLVKGKKSKTKIAFGPFLAFGAIITLIWGNLIINWYLHLLF